jgi:Tfp pilus assembly protein PilW
MPLRRSRSPRTSAPERGAGETGHTLVELIVASALLLVVIVAVLDAFDTVSTSQAFQSDRTVSLDNMRGVVNSMTRRLRQATDVTDCGTDSPTISFSTEINGTPTTIVYSASGTTLTETIGSNPPFTAQDHLAATNVFTCRSATDVTGVQWVDIDLLVTPPKAPNTTLELQGTVNLRNRTANLSGGAT